MKDLGLIQPNKTLEYAVSTVVSLANLFLQLGINTPDMPDKLREEFLDFQMSSDDLPTLSYKAADSREKPHALFFFFFWKKVWTMMTLDDQPRFYLLFKLMSGPLPIPCSNTDSRRVNIFNVKKDSHRPASQFEP